MSFGEYVRGFFGWLSGRTAAEREAAVAEIEEAAARCMSPTGQGKRRHLYLGGEFCSRGCGTPNPEWKPTAVPTEGA